MSEMEKALSYQCKKSHEAITKAMEDLGKLGYLVQNIDYTEGFFLIKCYCPQVKEGSKDGISNPVSWVGLSDNSDTTGKAQ